jgi:hypothetical protein
LRYKVEIQDRDSRLRYKVEVLRYKVEIVQGRDSRLDGEIQGFKGVEIKGRGWRPLCLSRIRQRMATPLSVTYRVLDRQRGMERLGSTRMHNIFGNSCTTYLAQHADSGLEVLGHMLYTRYAQHIWQLRLGGFRVRIQTIFGNSGSNSGGILSSQASIAAHNRLR